MANILIFFEIFLFIVKNEFFESFLIGKLVNILYIFDTFGTIHCVVHCFKAL